MKARVIRIDYSFPTQLPVLYTIKTENLEVFEIPATKAPRRYSIGEEIRVKLG